MEFSQNYYDYKTMKEIPTKDIIIFLGTIGEYFYIYMHPDGSIWMDFDDTRDNEYPCSTKVFNTFEELVHAVDNVKLDEEWDDEWTLYDYMGYFLNIKTAN